MVVGNRDLACYKLIQLASLLASSSRRHTYYNQLTSYTSTIISAPRRVSATSPNFQEPLLPDMSDSKQSVGFPYNQGQTNDGWSNEDEATATCACGKVQMVIVSAAVILKRA